MSSGQDGYFPRGRSVLRQVQEERLVGLMFGQRALCIGACSPLNYVGTAEHSRHQLTPFRRLAQTGQAFEQVFFGSRSEADRVLAYVRRMHDRVRGALSEDAGVTPAGTPYDAMDPELMLWTMAVMCDSAQFFYELFVRRLSDGEREDLWQDYVRFACLFGMPRSAAPGSYPEFRAWWRSRLAAEDLYLTEEARYIGYATAFEIPFPRQRRPGKPLHDAVMLGSLPPPVRNIYELPWGWRQQAEYAAGAAVFRTARRLTPGPLARGECGPAYEDIAREERRRIDRGEPTPQVTPEGPVNIRLPGLTPAA